MPSTLSRSIVVREISPEEFTAFVQGKDINPIHAIGFYNRMLIHGETPVIYGGFENGQLRIAMIAHIVTAWRLFHWLYAPLGFIMEDYTDLGLIQGFMEGLTPIMKKKRVLYFRMETDVELQERDLNGDVVENGYNNQDWRNGMKEIGFEPSRLTVGYDKTRQTRWASVIDLAQACNGRTGFPVGADQLSHFEDNFIMKTEEDLLKDMDVKTKQSLKLAARPYIRVRPLAYDELDILEKLERSAAEHHHFQTVTFNMCQAMYKGFGDSCEVLYAWLDVPAYEAYMTKAYEEAKANYALRQEKYEQSPGRRNKKSLHTAAQDLEAAEKKMQEAVALHKEHGDEIPLSAAMFLLSPTQTIYMLSGSDRDYMRFAGAYAIQWEAIRRSLKRKALQYNFWGISGIFDPKDPSYGVFAFKKGFHPRVAEYAGEFTWYFMPALAKRYLAYLDKTNLQKQ